MLGKRSIIADTALALAGILGTNERFWLRLQADFDMEEACKRIDPALAKIEQIAA